MKIKEWFKKWKQGMNEITPFQNVRIRLIGQFITLMGIISGAITVVLIKQYWFLLLFAGALIVQIMAILGDYQQYNLHKKIEDIGKMDIEETKEVENGIEGNVQY